jgi:hypothetical protein
MSRSSHSDDLILGKTTNSEAPHNVIVKQPKNKELATGKDQINVAASFGNSRRQWRAVTSCLLYICYVRC